VGDFPKFLIRKNWWERNLGEVGGKEFLIISLRVKLVGRSYLFQPLLNSFFYWFKGIGPSFWFFLKGGF